MPVPNIFGNATTSIPLSQLDVNFNTVATLGNASIGLGNTTTTVGNLTLTNVTITSGTITGLSPPLTISQGGTGATTFAAANIAVLTSAQSFTAGQRGAISVLTDGATITPDFAVANNFSVTLGGNRTLANPTNTVAGQSGSIFITQDGTGNRTLAYGTNYDFAGGTAPTLSTTAAAVDRIDYVVRTATSIHAVFTANYS